MGKHAPFRHNRNLRSRGDFTPLEYSPGAYDVEQLVSKKQAYEKDLRFQLLCRDRFRVGESVSDVPTTRHSHTA
jgi:hypothetical protein